MHEVLGQLQSELAVVLEGLDACETQLTPKLHPEKWTIQQIVEHLLLSYKSTEQVLQTRIRKGTPTLAKVSPAQRIAQFTLITLGNFPAGHEAPAAVSPNLPLPLQSGAELSARVHESLERLDDLADKAYELFGRARCASHLGLGPLSIRQWRRFHLVHGRHHIPQIRRVRQDFMV